LLIYTNKVEWKREGQVYSVWQIPHISDFYVDRNFWSKDLKICEMVSKECVGFVCLLVLHFDGWNNPVSLFLFVDRPPIVPRPVCRPY
jgi:hypothetical protein